VAGRRAAAFVLALAVAPALIGCQAAAPTSAGAGAGPPAEAIAPVAESFRSPREYEAVAAPVRLRIPAARVDTSLLELGRAADGTIEVPKPFDIAGWFAEGPRPGQPGPAVILGHVDSKAGPAVFYHLRGLKPGTPVHVDRADGSTVTFRVTGVSRVPKTLFPTDLVYAPTLQPSLRLVTCGGSFDRKLGSYRDNVIVYAELG
jgi:Sortase domain